MATHRDSPGIDPEPLEADEVRPDRRFVHLVGTSGSRRLALPRLTLAIAIGLSSVGLALYLGRLVIRSATSYVASLPDQQLPFERIELEPEPGAWVKGGKARLLEQVREASKREKTIPLLDFDARRLADDLLLHGSWVKRVARIERPPRGLVVHLEYRQPVAVVVVKPKGGEPNLLTIDEQAVPHATDDIEWKSKTEPFEVAGIAHPLILIMGVDPRARPSFGDPWRRPSEDGSPGQPDKLVLGAARIAAFLQTRPATTPKGKPAPRISEIWLPEDLAHPYYLKDRERNLIRWPKPPGEEAAGEPSAEQRWRLLLDYVDEHGSIEAKFPDSLEISGKGVELYPTKTASRKTSSSR